MSSGVLNAIDMVQNMILPTLFIYFISKDLRVFWIEGLVIPPLALLCTFWYPESPRHLHGQKEFQACKETLKQIADANGNIIGKVTSGTQSPTLNKAIGMGYVNKDFAKADTEIFVVIRDKAIKAKVCKIPFLKK